MDDGWDVIYIIHVETDWCGGRGSENQNVYKDIFK